MKRAIIRRTEHYSCEVEIPDEWDDWALAEAVGRGEFGAEIDNAEYDDCTYDLEIME